MHQFGGISSVVI